ncbi:MAG: NFACT family protein, partial [Clostridia bacterium]|nr:NFACT family protein [Clostridia bacterium]
MPKDALTYFHIAKQLDQNLSNGKIERICMPDKDSVVLFARALSNGRWQQFKILFSVNPSSARVSLINDMTSNPQSAFAFLMHLRKRINGGIIKKIDTVKRERIYRFTIFALDELGYGHDYILYAEMMGRYANLILTDENGVITDCLRHISMDETQKHALLPGLKYTLPPAPEGTISPDDSEKVVAVLHGFDGGRLADYLMEKIYGYAPVSMRQLVYSAYGTLTPSPDAVKFAPSAFIDAIKRADEENYPCVKTTNGIIDDFYPFAYTHLGVEFTPATSLTDAMEKYYSQKVGASFSLGKTIKLASSVRNAIKKLEKSLEILADRVLVSQDYEADKIKGELITANIYKIRQGDSAVTVDNYYTGKTETIELDSTLSPQKNAQKFYKSYTKKKTALAKSQEMIESTSEKIDYLQSILVSLATADDELSIDDIKAELFSAGVLKHTGSKKKTKPSRPIELT